MPITLQNCNFIGNFRVDINQKKRQSNYVNLKEKRNDGRYKDYARIDAPELCVLPGMLLDISKTGCRVKFPVPVEINEENECELNIQPSCRQGLKPFSLTVRPVWTEEAEDNNEAGFSIIGASDTRRLSSYLNVLHQASLDSDELLLKELCL